MLTGTHSGQVGAGLTDVITWTSADGAHWARHALSRSGVRFPTGTASVSSVAADQATLVIAGGIEDDTSTTQPNRLAFWRSTDAGVHWSQVATAHDLGAAYRAYAEQLVVTADSFTLLARHHRRRRLDLQGRRVPLGRHPSRRPWVTFGSVGQKPSDAKITSGAELGQGSAVSGSGLGGAGNQSAGGGTAVGDVAIIAGRSAATGSVKPVIWRISAGTATQVALPSAATAGRPTVDVASMMSRCPLPGHRVGGRVRGGVVVGRRSSLASRAAAREVQRDRFGRRQ